MTRTKRIYLSPPHLGDLERQFLNEALDSNWIAPLGPQVDNFEKELASYVKLPHAAALSSGTAALHLALQVLGVGAGDTVFVSTLTFVASANAVRYVGANPVFIDSDADSWTMDPALLAEALSDAKKRGQLPKAVIVVDIYGQCADYGSILTLCEQYGVPVIEDAAEALGAFYRGQPAGGFGALGVFSFNGNKIITTSGGGMLVGKRSDWIERTRFLATQARDAERHYQHTTLGYNYRMSNLLAAVGRGQLQVLDQRVNARRRINSAYREMLGANENISFMNESQDNRSTFWLTCITLSASAKVRPITLIEKLEAQNIEARPLWKPMHMQPLYAQVPYYGGNVSEALFQNGLCLPSGSDLTEPELTRITEIILNTLS